MDSGGRNFRSPRGGWVVLSLAMAVGAGPGCGGRAKPAARPAPPPPPAAQPAPPLPRPQTRPAVARRGTLFDRMGGDEVMRAVVDDFVTRAAADPAVNFTRRGHAHIWNATPDNLDRLKRHFVEFLTTLADGKATYHGGDMVTVHKGMEISGAEFDALAAHLGTALDAHGVGRREREELLAAVRTTRGAIVEVADPPPPAPQPPPSETTTGTQPDAPKPQDAKPEEPKEPGTTGDNPAPKDVR